MSHMIQPQIACVDHASEIDIECHPVRLLEIPVGIESLGEIVCTTTDPGIRKDMVNAIMEFFCMVEESSKVRPGCDICFHEAEVWMGCRTWIEVTTDDLCAELQKEF